MSESRPVHGSSASGPMPWQPLADRPTEAVQPVGRDTRQDTVVSRPVMPPAPRWAEDDSVQRGSWRHDDTPSTRPDYWDAPVVVRRADTLAGLLLLLAGIAAGVSLLVVWMNGGAIGLDMVRHGLEDLNRDPQRLAGRNTWEPLAVAFGGAVLFLIGLLVFVPAKTHRFLGAIALIVTLVVAAGVLVPLANANWDLDHWAVGGWFTAAVAGLGLLGAFKALATNPRSSRS
jgi:hypothetical protein